MHRLEVIVADRGFCDTSKGHDKYMICYPWELSSDARRSTSLSLDDFDPVPVIEYTSVGACLRDVSSRSLGARDDHAGWRCLRLRDQKRDLLQAIASSQKEGQELNTRLQRVTAALKDAKDLWYSTAASTGTSDPAGIPAVMRTGRR